jgi:type I restriction enzyme, S subunit
VSEARGVPALRFPEFSAEWVKKRLGETARFLKGKSISKADIVTADGIPCIRYGELYTIYGEVISKVESQTNLPIRELVLSEADDVIIPASGETALDIATASCVEKGDIALGGDLNIIRSPLIGHFLAYYLSHRKKKDIARLAQGNSVVHLYKDQLASLKIGTPTLPEQRKIADFLGAVDARMGLLRRRRDALRSLKKGMMQRLFSQELRFTKADGSPFPDWQEKRLGEVFQVTRGNVLAMPLVSEVPEGNKIYPVYSSQTKANGLAGYYDEFLYKDAITWTTDGANAGDTRFRTGKFYCTNVCGVLLSNEGYANTFMAELINSVSKHYVSYVGNPKLMNGVMASIKIAIPHPEEQQKIADTLTAIDAKIDAVTAQVEAMGRFKKGLLQQMFV